MADSSVVFLRDVYIETRRGAIIKYSAIGQLEQEKYPSLSGTRAVVFLDALMGVANVEPNKFSNPCQRAVFN